MIESFLNIVFYDVCMLSPSDAELLLLWFLNMDLYEFQIYFDAYVDSE